MIIYTQAILEALSLHHIPNKLNDNGGLIYSERPVKIQDESLRDSLCKYFFYPFKEPDLYCFDHISYNSNPVYNLAVQIFQNPASVHECSLELAALLHAQSDHPNIKDGDLIISYVQDLLFEDEMLDALVIVKSENKENFLGIDKVNGGFDISLLKGIALSKLDKACIVLNTQADSGYLCLMTDKTSPNDEARFWANHFLGLKQTNNDYQKTKVYIQATKHFIDERLKPMYEIEKQDEAGILISSKSYFEKNEDFDESNYLDTLFGDQEDIKSEFSNYRSDFEHDTGQQLSSDFKVSQAAVKNQSRVFKSVIKLDKNFHIYVHGNRNMIERGVDEIGRKFYKLYYEDEK
jgi:hypothetical protein